MQVHPPASIPSSILASAFSTRLNIIGLSTEPAYQLADSVFGSYSRSAS